MLQFLDFDTKVDNLYKKEYGDKIFTPSEDRKKLMNQHNYIDMSGSMLKTKKIFKKINKAMSFDLDTAIIQKDYFEGVEIQELRRGELKMFRYIAVSKECYNRCRIAVDLLNSMSDQKYFTDRFINTMSMAIYHHPDYDATEFDTLSNSEMCSYYLYKTVESLLSQNDPIKEYKNEDEIVTVKTKEEN